MRVTVNQEMSCQVFLREQNAPQEGEGAFVDLKKYPERINELHEAQSWPAFGEFIRGINCLRDLRTSGSKAEGNTPGGYAEPFVDFTFADSLLSKSANVQYALRELFIMLTDIAIADDLEIEVCASAGYFPGGEEAHSTRIWFKGSHEQAAEAFPVLLGFLAAQSADMFRQIAQMEMAIDDNEVPETD